MERSPTTPRVRTVSFNYKKTKLFKGSIWFHWVDIDVMYNAFFFVCVWYYYFGCGSSIFGSHGCSLEKAGHKVGVFFFIYFRILVLGLGALALIIQKLS